MNIIYFLIPLALLLGISFLGAYIFSSWRGQFDDLETPAHRMLLGDEIDDRFENKVRNGAKKGPTT